MAFAANQIVQQHGGIVVVENGEIRIYDIDRSGEETVLVLEYRISFTEVAGAKAFVSSDGSTTIYLVEAGE